MAAICEAYGTLTIITDRGDGYIKGKIGHHGFYLSPKGSHRLAEQIRNSEGAVVSAQIGGAPIGGMLLKLEGGSSGKEKARYPNLATAGSRSVNSASLISGGSPILSVEVSKGGTNELPMVRAQDKLPKESRRQAKPLSRLSANHSQEAERFWQVESNLYVCRSCGARFKSVGPPRFCPECNYGKEQL